MGFRFRRRLRLLPGVRLNVSKAGFASISAGVRGLTLNLGRKGTRTTVGLPGSGLSYTSRLRSHTFASQRVWRIAALLVVLLAVFYWILR